MRRLLLGTTLVSLLLTGGGCKDAEFSNADETAIRKVLDDQKAAWNAADIETFMAGYHDRPDIIFTSGGKIRRGYAETLGAYTTKYVDGSKMGTLDFRDVEVQGLGSQGAVALGHWQLTGTPEAGGGVFSLIFHREDGRWGIVHDHTSASPTPAEPAPE